MATDPKPLDLERRFRAALMALDATPFMAWAEFTIRDRTRKGVFLNAPVPGYSTGHKRRREKDGLQVAHPDLIMTGSMLDAITSDAARDDDGLTLRIGYIDGLSDAAMTQRARYHQGPKARPERAFVGLSDAERDDGLGILRAEIKARIDDL